MKAVAFLVAAAAVNLLGSAGRADDKVDYTKLIVGKWEVTKASPGTVPPGAIVEFTKDGKLNVTHKEDDKELKTEGTYKVEKNKFTMSMKIGDEVEKKTITIVKISEKEMSTKDEDDNGVELKKVR